MFTSVLFSFIQSDISYQSLVTMISKGSMHNKSVSFFPVKEKIKNHVRMNSFWFHQVSNLSLVSCNIISIAVTLASSRPRNGVHRNFKGVSTNFLKQNQKIFWRFQEGPRNVVPRIDRSHAQLQLTHTIILKWKTILLVECFIPKSVIIFVCTAYVKFTDVKHFLWRRLLTLIEKVFLEGIARMPNIDQYFVRWSRLHLYPSRSSLRPLDHHPLVHQKWSEISIHIVLFRSNVTLRLCSLHLVWFYLVWSGPNVFCECFLFFLVWSNKQ